MDPELQEQGSRSGLRNIRGVAGWQMRLGGYRCSAKNAQLAAAAHL